MDRRNRCLSLFVVLAAAPAALIAALMLRTHTIIDVPEAGQDIPLSGLSYKANAFEAKVTSARLELKGEAGADPLVADWVFAGSNSDGQMHRLEMQVRLRNESGDQITMFSKYFALAPGAHDQECRVPMKVKAEDWKATRTVRIVVDWLS